AFSRSGWLWPVDAKGEPLKATSYMAVGFYVAKYVNKKSDMDLAAKGLGAKEWNNSLKTKLSLLPKKLFRIRDRKSGSAGMPRPISYAVFCLKKKNIKDKVREVDEKPIGRMYGVQLNPREHLNRATAIHR